jgi:chorismate lyase / 3-hydroxybenzoate synthase
MRSVSLLELVPTYVPLRSAAADASARISFGDPLPGSLFVPMRQLGPEPLAELWRFDDQVLFGGISVEEHEPLESLSRGLYSRLIQDIRDAGYPYFIRMWNHVGGINEYDGESERYKLFCAGRHDAFVNAGYHHDVDLPAASAVGMRGRGLIAYFLAAKQPGMQVENPRQVAAYNYPPQYGVKSPSFSRATVWNDTMFVSGTSSVVGHATVHKGDVMAQLEETLRNIDVVLAETGRSMSDVASAKTYIRNPSDYEAIAKRLEPVFANNICLEADICREDLLLEIECVAR